MELTLTNINKSFKKNKVVSDVNLTLHEGIYGLLGANGSGKTTLIRMMCGIIPFEKGGRIVLDGMDAMKQYDTYVAHLGYMPQHFGFYPNYTVQEFLNYMGIVKGLSKSYCQKRIPTLLKQLNLESIVKKKMKNLSGGMLQRIGIAQALLNEPKILILDEPTTGLDPKERIAFRNFLGSISQTCIVLLSTHIITDVENLADDILIMKEGEIIQHNKSEELLKVMDGKVWSVLVSSKKAEELSLIHTVISTNYTNDKVELRIISDSAPYENAQEKEANLDDLYIYYFGDGDTQ